MFGLGAIPGSRMNEYGNVSPFSVRMPEAPPAVLKPFVYCAYRVTDEQGTVEICASLAATVLHEMPFCYGHGKLIQIGLDQEKASGTNK